jgi:hypothetical protein
MSENYKTFSSGFQRKKSESKELPTLGFEKVSNNCRERTGN